MQHYPQTFDGLSGSFSDFRRKLQAPFKKVLGKKIFSGLNTGFNRYGLTALAAAATIVTGGAASPALLAAASAATLTTVGAENAKKAQRAAKREALRLAGQEALQDAELDKLPDYTFPPDVIVDAAGNPVVFAGLSGQRLLLIGGGVVVAGTLLWLILRKR